MAQEFAKGLLCLETPGEPCGHCRSCSLFGGGNHPDFLIIGGDGEKIKIEQIRELQRTIGFHPVLSPRKVIFIPFMEKMTEVAANGFLKTLEEPPVGVHFLGAAVDEKAVLTTILSRMQLIRLAYVATDKIAAGLVHMGCPPEQASVIAGQSRGLPGVAITCFLDKEAATEDWAGLLEYPNPMLLLRKAAGAEKISRDQVARWLDELTLYYRSKLLSGKPEEHPRTLEALTAIQTARDRLAFNVNSRLLLEGLLLQISGL